MNPADVLDCIVNDLASSPVTVTVYRLLENALPNVMGDILGVPVNDTADPEAAFKDCSDPVKEPVIPPVTVSDPDTVVLF